MKCLFPLAAVVALVAPASAAVIPASSRITAVTVYNDRAIVTRNAPVELQPGTHDIVFESLPATLADQSLQVSGSGLAGTTIIDINAKQNFVEATPNERVRILENELKELQRQDRLLEDRTGILNEEKEFVRRMLTASTTPPTGSSGGTAPARPSLDEWRQLQTYANESFSRISTETQSIDRQRAELRDKQTAVQQQINQLRGAGGRSEKSITVRVDATTAGRAEIAVTYAVPNASWTPAYDVRMRSAARTVELSYFGVVRQNTGEDWNNVALTLSTARPSMGGAAPELLPWVLLSAADEAARQRSMVGVASAQGPSGARGGGGGGRGGRGGGAELAAAAPAAEPMQQAQAAVDFGATSATFSVAAPATVPSNNTTQKVSLTRANLNAIPRYNTTPKLREAAYLTATTLNNSDFPLLAGMMNTFLDDVFIATSSLKTVMPGEQFDLALGVDDGIAVKRRVVNRFVENTGLTSSSRKITYDFLVTITNNKRTAERITLREPIPTSRHESIVVRLLSPAAGDIGTTENPKEIMREPNGLAWQFTLRPGEKREIPIKFSVEHPADFPIAGLE